MSRRGGRAGEGTQGTPRYGRTSEAGTRDKTGEEVITDTPCNKEGTKDTSCKKITKGRTREEATRDTILKAPGLSNQGENISLKRVCRKVRHRRLGISHNRQPAAGMSSMWLNHQCRREMLGFRCSEAYTGSAIPGLSR